ncbi:PREDICTED: chaperone protein dnaJ 1, mitochondrial-like [Dufourea novaeangliae]|uniref:chaperone protein dnaJ 1, mitochondrial-like n=1 Tax=Dufourea novaeangliae TaxID=178035 RepID=UPI0007671D3B|nr:PREDICTED: chaperone protein dnaJ 1, mitochondrial-like [Dufourea novaeangliae]
MFTQLSVVTYSGIGIMATMLRQYILPINMKMNLSTQSKTHYDTLKLSPKATHNEIKSAYYKLTLEYHPDKNKSESAKEIFQQLSDAYEVLGNHKLRKQYDRTIAVKRINIDEIQRTSSRQEHTVKSTDKIYNFDEWSQAHYGLIFQKSMYRKSQREEYLKRMKWLHQDEKSLTRKQICVSLT